MIRVGRSPTYSVNPRNAVLGLGSWERTGGSCLQFLELRGEVTEDGRFFGDAQAAEFAAFLVDQGIDSISVTPDALARTIARVAEAEASLAR